MTFIALLIVSGILWALARRSRQRPQVRPAPKVPGSAQPRTTPFDRGGAPAQGLALGHALAQHHHVAFGDPLPHGHLGSAASIAFWSGMTLDDDED